MEPYIVIAIIGIMYYLLFRKLNIEVKKHQTKQMHKTKIFDSSYKGCYQRKYLFTKNEYNEFKKLVSLAKDNDLYVFAKVRLLDLIEPRKGIRKYRALLYKVQSKHVDFVVTDKNYYVKAIIELDDNSHNIPERIRRDKFVNEILTDVGYKVIWTRAITEETVKSIVGQQESTAPTEPGTLPG